MPSSGGSLLFRLRSDAALVGALRILAVISAAVILLIALFLFRESWTALREVGVVRFLADPSWNPAPNEDAPAFNLLPMIVGTLVVTAGAVLLAAPLGITAALFCRFYAPAAISGPYRRMIELLAGIPSVVYGLWGLVVIVPLIAQWHPPGPSVLAGVLILAMMVLPTVTLATDAALENVPAEYHQAAAALALSRWTTIRSILLPAARSGVITGVLLQTARALGETMAVLMVCGNVVQIPGSPFDSARTLTANIALEMAYAMGTHRSALFVSGLFLMAVVSMFVLIAHLVRREAAHA